MQKFDHRKFGLEQNVGVFYFQNKQNSETFSPYEDCLVLYSVKMQFALNQESNPEILLPECPLLYVVRHDDLDYEVT